MNLPSASRYETWTSIVEELGSNPGKYDGERGRFELTNAPMQYRKNPEQAISCAGREGNGKCGATSRNAAWCGGNGHSEVPSSAWPNTTPGETSPGRFPHAHYSGQAYRMAGGLAAAFADDAPATPGF
jgi:hypothetical protein